MEGSSRTYSELIEIVEFKDRLEYLKLYDNNVTSPRHMSMPFYKSRLWQHVRKNILRRDLGFDLGVYGVYIDGPMFVHHINPINENDIIYQTDRLLNPENLITTSHDTHTKIHYKRQEEEEPWVERTPGDTIFW